jgi:hypothetical protein
MMVACQILALGKTEINNQERKQEKGERLLGTTLSSLSSVPAPTDSCPVGESVVTELPF